MLAACLIGLALIDEAHCGLYLGPTFSIGMVKNQTGYLRTHMQTMPAIGISGLYRIGFLRAGSQLEAGVFDQGNSAAAALDAGLSVPGWMDAVRVGLRGGVTYNGYMFTHWYGSTSFAEGYNHFLSPMAGADLEMGRWRIAGEYLFASHLIWKARIGFRLFGKGFPAPARGRKHEPC